ncbi:hypothetical protein ERO13_A11G102900v2 [Gossypium hirsutum]|uniref:Major facilitator superfamily (MFS) profile domain-containing protein n=2 Tax=Gossypium TaxID=3633 RepID=A0A5J5TLE6_GOSBA|nr:hypothetical protein ES319_A11G110600v1 [Gossypium barbadense]KAG4174173.1 hypothetical protein ERO13_A11G102900v2 [Gossypium hirsutum]TYG93545.1 hypothetical protein ES288_A11G118100v1 [Gossypium darwinii]
MRFQGEEEAAAKVPVTSPFGYNSPLVQVSLIGLVCFCCPGMFNALTGMGGGGQVNPDASNNANTALYTTFSIFGIPGGGVYNIFGPKITLAMGCSTYVLYAGSFLYYNHQQDQTFAIFAGALLGIGASFLWAGQGAIMTSYPTATRKGTYISLFWIIFNLGGVIGGFIPFILNYHRKAETVNDMTYIVFMCFMSAGTLISLTILSPDRVVKDDGTHCTNIKYSNVTTEAIEILKLFRNWKLLLIVLAAWASNFFYSYQFDNVNGLMFNPRTRGFNNVFYWGAQMIGSVGIGYILDFSFKSRRTRGLVGVGIVAVLGTAIWAGGLANQLNYSFDKPPKRLDFKRSGSDFAGPPFILYFSYGLLDAMFQCLVYWVIGALADTSETLSSRKKKIPLLNQLIVNWVLTTLSYPLLAVLIYKAVKDTDSNKPAEDDDTASGLPPPASMKDGYKELENSITTEKDG